MAYDADSLSLTARIWRTLGLGTSGFLLASCEPCPLDRACFELEELAEHRRQTIEEYEDWAQCRWLSDLGPDPNEDPWHPTSVLGGAGGAEHVEACPPTFHGFSTARAKEIHDILVAWDPTKCPDTHLLKTLASVNESQPSPPGQKQSSEEGQCCYAGYNCGAGRPLLIAQKARLPDVSACVPHFSGSYSSQSLVDVWIHDARMEYASVAAFARLALQLLSHGAPMELVAAAQRASLDEARHAHICLAQAELLSGSRFKIGPLDLTGLPEMNDVVELFTTNILEGCVGETLAAARAYQQAKLASGGLAKELFRLAKDEERHAILAWRILQWMLSEPRFRLDADQARRILLHAFTNTDHSHPASTTEGSQEEWNEAGRLTTSQSITLDACTWKQSIWPLIAGLTRRTFDERRAAAPVATHPSS